MWGYFYHSHAQLVEAAPVQLGEKFSTATSARREIN